MAIKICGSESYQAANYFEGALKALGNKFQGMYATDRTPGFDDELDENSPVFLEFNDQYNKLSEMDPELVAQIVKTMPNLKPANQAIAELKKEGYVGFPKPNGQFSSDCFALTLPEDIAKAVSMKTMLVMGKIDHGTYDDELSYLEVVANRLTKRFIELGVPDADASLQISNSPGLSIHKNINFPAQFTDPDPSPLPDELGEAFTIRLTPEPIIPRPPARVMSTEEAHDDIFNREASLKILLSYEEPQAYMQPTKAQVMHAISNMPELVPASKMVEELKQAGYDGWNEIGVYPDDVYALDITKMPNHIADSNYPKLILFSIYNSSHATVPTPDEIEIQTALNKAMSDAGFSNVGIEISSDGDPKGPNYFKIVHSGYCPPEEEVRKALASIPGISPDPTKPQPVGVPGYLASSGKFSVEKTGVLDPGKANQLGALGYMGIDMKFSPLGMEHKALVNIVEIDLHQIPALANLVTRLNVDKVHIYLTENIVGGY